MDFFDKELSVFDINRKAIPLFGFADYNLCTAKWLYQNRIPAMTKDGYETVGFKISGKDRWKRFDSIEKPPEEVWTKELERIRTFYRKAIKKNKEEAKGNLERLMEEMCKSYELGKSFSDVNAILFSRVCNLLLGLLSQAKLFILKQNNKIHGKKASLRSCKASTGRRTR
ncbi:MAG TPA: hypothetical protein ENI32_05485 [Candidatus Syntrophoarchaeum butanivorans]|uniref:Uncharacterized protein n=1 Tax=Candidatus Syntropharchaeum butanivorans TaxID=1839936 RepID=A0A7J2S1F3_9EURY|nr:hypothetical protein [Candidatus Syntrophoarchaeum butanivorans]